MKLPLRYVSALVINLLLPWLVYRLAHAYWRMPEALLASTLPLLAWMIWDLARHRHFDALSALVLAGIVLSVLARAVPGAPRKLSLDEPLVAGMTGVAFLLSLTLPRPAVYYLARSTMARESLERASEFERDWHEQPKLAARIRNMTLVWGIGLIMENAVRTTIVLHGASDPHSIFASNMVRYGCYSALMLWTFWYRRRIRQDAETYVGKGASEGNPQRAAAPP
jgi:hypothetical protein